MGTNTYGCACDRVGVHYAYDDGTREYDGGEYDYEASDRVRLGDGRACIGDVSLDPRGCDPPGNTAVMTGTASKSVIFLFSPKPHDRESGLYYYGSRYHSPSLGRWINRDPIGEWGGINVYVIGLNTVINTFDILGLKATTEACCCAGKKFDFGKKCCLKSQECKGKVCRIRIYIGHSGDNMKAKLKSQDGLGGADRVAAVSCMQQTMNALIPSDQS